jgi:CBS-domain-containing membrane protein
MSDFPAASQCRVYDGHGGMHYVSLDPCSHDLAGPADRQPEDVPIASIMTRNIVCARPELQLDALIGLMIQNHIGCVPIVDERGRPHGIVTKLDLVEAMQEPPGATVRRTAGDVMMPIALTLDERATVAHAVSMMTLEDLHHVMIVSCHGTLIGVVSSKDVVRWLAETGRAAL